MDKTFAVVGLGTFGYKLCEVLSEKGAKVIAIDNDAGLVDRVRAVVTQAVLVDATDQEAIGNAPLEDVDVAIVAIGDNIEANILATALLKQKAVPYVVSRAVSELHQKVLQRVGADEVVNIEIDEGVRVANGLIAPDILNEYPISSDISIAELAVPPILVDATLAEVALRTKYQVTLVSIRRIETSVDELGNPVRDEIVVFPGPDDALAADDILLIVGKNDDIEKFRALGENAK